jgi:Ca2+/Na+ antiporter
MTHARVWRFSRELGSGSAMTFVGSGPLAILAGFALSATVSVSEHHGGGALRDVAVLLLAISVSSLVVTLIFVIKVQMYWATPSDRLGWRPEATVCESVLEEERKEQLRDYHVLVKYHNRVDRTFYFGLFSAMSGLATSILADSCSWGNEVGAILVYITAVAIVFCFFEKPRRLFPSPDQEDDRTPDSLDDVGRASVLRKHLHL